MKYLVLPTPASLSTSIMVGANSSVCTMIGSKNASSGVCTMIGSKNASSGVCIMIGK